MLPAKNTTRTSATARIGARWLTAVICITWLAEETELVLQHPWSRFCMELQSPAMCLQHSISCSLICAKAVMHARLGVESMTTAIEQAIVRRTSFTWLGYTPQPSFINGYGSLVDN